MGHEVLLFPNILPTASHRSWPPGVNFMRTHRRASVLPGLRVGILVCCLLLPAVQGKGPDVLQGELRFLRATLEGQTETMSPATRALHLIAPPVSPLDIEWSLDASRVTVNWTRVTKQGMGGAPNNPNESFTTVGSPEKTFGEARYAGARLSSAISSPGANLHVETRRADLEANVSTTLEVQPSKRETWTGGLFSNQSGGLGPDARLLTRDFVTAAGEPIVRSQGGLRATLRGDFAVYVWQADVAVQAENRTTIHRSGSWYDNATGTQAGPRGITRTEHWQLVRIEVAEGILQVDHQSGLAQWTAPQISSRTTGSVLLDEATGTLTSQQYVYSARSDRIRIDGTISQRMKTDSSSARLSSELEATDSTISLAPVAIGPKTTTIEGGEASWYVLGAITILVGAALAWLGPHWWFARKTDTELLGRAQNALVQGRPVAARRYASILLRRDRDDKEAWFLYGAALFSQHRDARVLRDLGRLPNDLKDHPPIAFVLSKSHERRKDLASAVHWLERAIVDPEVREAARGSPAFVELSRRSRWRVLLRSDPNPAYA